MLVVNDTLFHAPLHTLKNSDVMNMGGTRAHHFLALGNPRLGRTGPGGWEPIHAPHVLVGLMSGSFVKHQAQLDSLRESLPETMVFLKNHPFSGRSSQFSPKQAYFEYDAKKSGGVTISHLRFGPKPIHAPCASASSPACRSERAVVGVLSAGKTDSHFASGPWRGAKGGFYLWPFVFIALPSCL